MDAIRLRRVGSTRVELHDNNLSTLTQLSATPVDNAFDLAHRNLVSRGLELDIESKLSIVEQISRFPARLDFSGGDPLAVEENWQVLALASELLGKENVSLTATGAGIKTAEIPKLASLITEVNVTYAPTAIQDEAARPKAYVQSNLQFAKKLQQNGLKVRVEVPLTQKMCRDDVLKEIYEDSKLAGAHSILLMRLFPVGRGKDLTSEAPSPLDYTRAIQVFRKLEQEQNGPKVKLQCALRFLERKNLEANPCDLATNSFGIMPNGNLLLSPWALSTNGMPISKEWVIGSILEHGLGSLIGSQIVQDIQLAADTNFGHCKIFAALTSKRDTFVERLLSPSDPLYEDQRVE